MNILLIGSGGREHALARAIASSPLTAGFYAAPGNPGIEEHAVLVTLDSNDPLAVIDFCRQKSIDLVVVGPELPLVNGLVDALEGAGIRAFGPTAAAARLEGSKGFTKDLCREFGIPTAAYARFTDAASAKAYLAEKGAPIVVKADGLAAGKGVVVAQTLEEAEAAIDANFAGRQSADTAGIVIEDFLEGEEVSFFALSDGDSAVPFASAQDHKRALDGDQGPNTGGMGAYSPAPVLTAKLEKQVMDEIISPTVKAMLARGTPFKGVLYAGLMLTASGPKLIEYNVRFGDPEAQVILPRLKSDIVRVLSAVAEGALRSFQVQWHEKAALCVVMAAKGYPGPVAIGSEIRGLERADSLDDVEVYHAGTRREGDRILSNGGRVLGITATARTIAEAKVKAYGAVEVIDWPEGYCRTDIGWRAAGQ